MANVFYVPGKKWVEDIAMEVAPGVFVAPYSGNRDLAQMQVRHPGVVVIEEAEANRQIEELARSPAVEISQERFDELLNVLPPMKWRNSGSSESFMLSERITGCITTIAVRLGEDYFSLADRTSLTHDEICQACEPLRLIKRAMRDATLLVDVATPLLTRAFDATARLPQDNAGLPEVRKAILAVLEQRDPETYRAWRAEQEPALFGKE